MHDVASQHRGIVCEANGGDLEVLCPSLWQSLAQRAKDHRSLSIEGQKREFHEQFEAVLELLVTVNLFPAAGLLLADKGAPALAHFLRGDDGGEHTCASFGESLLQSCAALGVMHEFGEVIGIQHDEHRLTSLPGSPAFAI